MEFNEIKEAYIKLKTFAKESLKKNLKEDKIDTAKYLSGFLDGVYMMYREIEGSEEIFEKQIPKKPDFTEDKEFALCPCCNGKGLLNKQKYCDNCGQKLDWSDEE